MRDEAILDRLAATIAPGAPVEAGTGGEAIEADFRRLDALLAGDEAAHGLRLWTNSQCLVTTRRFAAMEGFAAAAAASATRGWPVYVRFSGGTTVAHRPGMLNVSRFEGWRCDDRDISRQFQEFCDRLARSLRSVGIEAGLGSVDRSHCDGRCNIIAHNRKLAGTASLVRRKGDFVGLLSHATLWISGNIGSDIQAIEEFENYLGLDPVYSVEAHATLGQLRLSVLDGSMA